MAKNGKKVRIFSALEVANICGVVNQTAINWIKSNHLKAFTTPGGQYRIYAEDLLSFLEERGMRIPEELEDLQRQKDQDKVLIIDDDRELNDMLKQFFSRKMPDWQISQAFDGFEAGVVLSREKPDIVILDIDLPGVNGHQLCTKIKKDESLGSPVIISVSGLDDEAESEKIISEGADAFFAKPVDFGSLLAAVQDLVAARG
ncbi:response regulator [Sediminispirochaeta smaragdinae]|jgi:excisionase family DNA binding protein|uniref:Response regulator receiver protein n=1 Tax=Sediminispirochaeta smaragdinae (strain DSM 11293 / JCM 15392 / SEBR 4228) TaxID=573413 RepID=E1R7Y1_SEDSS|nr:response regulator [Sediminispirochaeta smaragdinae]ADK82836.1 response regulator receiver protein [Sediminispirochaeta smaragdinae DSM 11293]